LAGLHALRTGGFREYGLDLNILQFSNQFYASCYRQIQERIWQTSTTSRHHSENYSTVSPPALTTTTRNNSGGLNGLNEMDILAALELFQYVLFSGETPKNYMVLLNVAFQWLEQQTNIVLDPNPARALGIVSPLMRMVVKMVIVRVFVFVFVFFPLRFFFFLVLGGLLT
jgi:hypothetical protein